MSRPDRHRHRRTPRRGFSLIEMMTALAIMAVISMIAIPKLNTRRFKQDSAARVVRSTLQIAGRLAVAKQFDILVSFDLSRNMIRLVEDKDNNGVLDAGERVTWRALEDEAVFELPATGLSGTPSGAVSGNNLATIDNMPSLIFRRNGAASSDLEIYIGAGTGRKQDLRAVTVLQSTGRADWFRYAANGWMEGGL